MLERLRLNTFHSFEAFFVISQISIFISRTFKFSEMSNISTHLDVEKSLVNRSMKNRAYWSLIRLRICELWVNKRAQESRLAKRTKSIARIVNAHTRLRKCQYYLILSECDRCLQFCVFVHNLHGCGTSYLFNAEYSFILLTLCDILFFFTRVENGKPSINSVFFHATEHFLL